MTIKEFRTLLRSTYKSPDTEENIDIYFTRPIGLFFALIWKRLGVHPNAVTILSFFLGMAAGWMFLYRDLAHNLCGIVLFMFANFCDSTDGQLARMTGKTSITGRMLDGFASDVWFTCAYVAIVFRLFHENIPFTDVHWGWWGFVLCLVAGVYGHARQCRLSDYYRNIHLFFVPGAGKSEYDTYANQKAIADRYRAERNWVGVLFYANYANYVKAQEQMTPEFQQLRVALCDKYGDLADVPDDFRKRFREASFPLMKYTNFLTHNWRAFTLFLGVLINEPWIYPLMELTVMQAALIHMHTTHENFCRRFREELEKA